MVLMFSSTFLTSFSAISSVTVDLPRWNNIKLGEKLSFRGSAVLEDSLWVTGSNNSIFVSQDAGSTWVNKSIPLSVTEGESLDIRDIALFTHDTAIVMSVGSGKKSALYKTLDGGNNWHKLYENRDEQGFYNSIAFWDENNGLIFGDPVDGYFVIQATKDAGKTWSRISKDQLPKIQLNEAAFAASGNTLITGNNGKAWFTTGGFSASVYQSLDYGNTWKRTPAPLYNNKSTAGGYALALNHKEQLFVVGGDYQNRSGDYQNIARLIDGEWKTVEPAQLGLRTAMTCQGNICVTTGKKYCDISFNAGSIWAKLCNNGMNLSNCGFYTLASDNMMFLAAGHDGQVGVLSFQLKKKNERNDNPSRFRKK